MTLRALTFLGLLPLTACAPDVGPASAEPGAPGGVDGKRDASAEAVFLRFEFHAELVTDWSWDHAQQIQDQLLFTIGQLNGERAVGRLDKLTLSNVVSEQVDGQTHISYDAVLPVAWSRRSPTPTTYTLSLPRDISYDGKRRFTEAYKSSCVDGSAHDVTEGSIWYYYRPHAWRCQLVETDIVQAEANVTESGTQTTGKYPEYHKVWEDDALRVVAVFGKYEDAATSPSDAGISAYNEFLRTTANTLAQYSVTTEPATFATDPGVDVPDVAFTGTLSDGRTVHVVALLVDGVRTAGPVFDARYRELSAAADLIAYNGHSGLGANIRALARKGDWRTGQYVVVFMNGCDTYAYVDSALAEAHMEVNADDESGSRYLDVVTNAMPAYFHADSEATTAFITGLLRHDAPETYEQIFGRVDRSQVVLVTGEEDNVYMPGFVAEPRADD